MRRITILVLVLTMCAAALFSPAAAGKRKKLERVAEGTYSEPAAGIQFPSYQMATCDSGCVLLDVYRGERFAEIEVEDALGLPVAAAVFPWDGDTVNPRYYEKQFCGATDKPVRIKPWVSVLWIEVLVGPCADGTPAMATQGKVVATLSNVR